MHIIDTKNKDLRTDLLIDKEFNTKKVLLKEDVELYRSNNDSYDYSTISFIDSTDKDQRKVIEEILIKEIKKYIKDSNNIIIIGLGNRLSTADSLGPKVLDNILVTRHLFENTEVEKSYKITSILEPKVYGLTGIDSTELIKEVVNLIKPDHCIFIDSLCTNNINRMNTTIQLTNRGISPGSGVLNNRGELSNNTLNCNVLAIGVPTVVNIHSLVKKNIDIDNLIVTPKEIDYLIENLSTIIGTSINKSLHKSYNSTE